MLPKGGFSIANDVRVIRQAVLKEISLVLFPANDLAQVTEVKSASEASPLAGVVKFL